MNLKKINYTYLKIAFSIIVVCLAYKTAKDLSVLTAGLLEITLVLVIANFLSNHLDRPKRIVLNIICSIFFFIINLQMLVMYFGGSYISMMMMTNLSSWRDIASNFGAYGLGIIALLVISFLPIHPFEFDKKWSLSILAVILGLYTIFFYGVGWKYNTIYSLYSLKGQASAYQELQDSIETEDEKIVDTASEFYQQDIKDYISKPKDLPEKPNVIVIFTEGLSNSVIEDERNITPNLQKFSKESLSFENYYNHTFATYRGLIGQLYSGYQLNNTDSNNLISIQSIFSDQGYNTAFINTEPKNEEFTTYLESFAFDNLVTDISLATQQAGSISDKDAYDMLYDTCIEMNEADEPFFTAIYTFGTHVTLDSPDEKFDDGKDAELNKFYNMDYQFGVFLNKFKKSELAENTILIFTADHCTYVDQAFRESFPDVERFHSDVGEMELYYYYVGIKPDTIDVQGRNTINFAPTLLDYLDISAPNFFLGSSLFGKDKDNLFATIFYDPFNAITTKDGELSELSEKEKKVFVKKVTRYFTESKKMKVDTIPLPTEEDSEAIDEGNYFLGGTGDAFAMPTYLYPYIYYDTTPETPAEPVPESTPVGPEVIEGGTGAGQSGEPVIDNSGGEPGGGEAVMQIESVIEE